MQVFSVVGLGGYSAAAGLDAEIRQRATKTTFLDQSSMGIASYGKHRSDRILIDKMGRVATPMSLSGIGETDPFPTTNFPFVQTSVIAAEYGNAVEWTERFETFSQWGASTLVGMALRQDQIEGMDKVAEAAYALGRVYYTPVTASTGVFSTTGSPGAVGTSVVTTAHLKDITDYLRQNAVPPLAGGDYFYVGNTHSTRGIKDSDDFIQVAGYSAPDKLFDHEVGRWSNMRIVEENNVLVENPGTSAVSMGEAYVFGSDHVVQAVAVGPHLRYKVPQNYGRDRGMAHLFIGGYALIWSFNNDSEEHGVIIGSS